MRGERCAMQNQGITLTTDCFKQTLRMMFRNINKYDLVPLFFFFYYTLVF